MFREGPLLVKDDGKCSFMQNWDRPQVLFTVFFLMTNYSQQQIGSAKAELARELKCANAVVEER